MGLELTTLGEIIGSEAKNNAADIFLFVRWLYEGNELLRQLPFNELYDSIDTQFGITGIDGIEYNASQAQARSQTNTVNISALDSRIDDLEEADVSWSEVTEKPSTFAPSAHDHDDFYLSPAWAPWVGDGTSDREIILSGIPIVSPKFLILLGFSGSSYLFGFWLPNIASGNIWVLTNSGFFNINSSWILSGDMIEPPPITIFTIKSSFLNQSDWVYRLFILGDRWDY